MTSRPSGFLATSLLFMIAICGQSAWATGEEDFRYPLLGPYAVRREDPRTSDGAEGVYQLVKPFGSGDEFEYAVVKVTKLAVGGQFIVGSADGGFFILDTAASDPQPRTFASEQSWRDAMRSAGIPPDIQLADPDVLAAKAPDYVLRPTHYRAMGRLLGLSDGDWCGILLLITASIMFLHGAIGAPRTLLYPLAIILGAIATIGGIKLGVLDAAAFLGFFSYPIAYLIVAMFGRLFRILIWDPIARRRTSPAEPQI